MKITKIISNYPEKRIKIKVEDLKQVLNFIGFYKPVQNGINNILDYSPRSDDENFLIVKKGEIAGLCRLISETRNYCFYKAFCALRKIAVNSKALIDEEASRIIAENYHIRRPPSKAKVKHKTGKYIM